ncbi:MAG: hypothetical protein ACJAVZ_002004 [Afipia broomeae]
MASGFVILFLSRPVVVLDSETAGVGQRVGFIVVLAIDRNPVSALDVKVGIGNS